MTAAAVTPASMLAATVPATRAGPMQGGRRAHPEALGGGPGVGHGTGHAVAPDGADCPPGALSGLGAVLSIGKLATGQGDYYLEQARGRVNAVTSVRRNSDDDQRYARGRTTKAASRARRSADSQRIEWNEARGVRRRSRHALCRRERARLPHRTSRHEAPGVERSQLAVPGPSGSCTEARRARCSDRPPGGLSRPARGPCPCPCGGERKLTLGRSEPVP